MYTVDFYTNKKKHCAHTNTQTRERVREKERDHNEHWPTKKKHKILHVHKNQRNNLFPFKNAFVKISKKKSNNYRNQKNHCKFAKNRK